MIALSGDPTADIMLGSLSWMLSGGGSTELKLKPRVASNPLIQAFSDCNLSNFDSDGEGVDAISSSYFFAFSSKSRI